MRLESANMQTMDEFHVMPEHKEANHGWDDAIESRARLNHG